MLPTAELACKQRRRSSGPRHALSHHILSRRCGEGHTSCWQGHDERGEACLGPHNLRQGSSHADSPLDSTPPMVRRVPRRATHQVWGSGGCVFGGAPGRCTRRSQSQGLLVGFGKSVVRAHLGAASNCCPLTGTPRRAGLRSVRAGGGLRAHLGAALVVHEQAHRVAALGLVRRLGRQPVLCVC